ncbi:MAG: hypothetical protein ACJ8EN_13665 [Xanthobacteraceae bacterium]
MSWRSRHDLARDHEAIGASRIREGDMPAADMQRLTGAVGENGENRRHEVALVQAALKIIKQSSGVAYFAGAIDGIPSAALNSAIRKFQDDSLTPRQRMFAGLGKVLPNSETFDALRAKLPPDKALGAIPNHRVVYRRATEEDLQAALDGIDQAIKMLPDFRRQLKQLSMTMHAKHGLVLSIAPRCEYRTFDDQLKVDPANTGAGPGESAHNFGIGCDFGFYKFAYLTDAGNWQEDTVYLDELAKKGLSDPFWKQRNEYFRFGGMSLAKTDRLSDKVHVQAVEDKKAKWGLALCDLMNREASCYWDFKHGHYYSSLLFTDEPKWQVGSAKAIWTKQAPMSQGSIAEALEEGRTLRNAIGELPAPLEGIYLKFAGNDRDRKKAWTAGEITNAHVTQMRAYLREDFETAERQYRKWRAAG